MVNINLLKQAPKHRKSRSRIRISTHFIVVVGLIFVLTATALLAMRFFFDNSKKKLAMDGQKVNIIIKDDYNPSSLTNSRAVEEVVRDVDSRGEVIKRNGVQSIAYDKLSFLEKVNYEVNFGRTMFGMFSRVVKPGVQFKQLVFSNFTTVYGSGVCESENQVRNLFSTLRSNGVILDPKPHSRIIRHGTMYKFDLSGNCLFDLDFNAPFFIGKDDIPDSYDCDHYLKELRLVATECGFKFTKDPKESDSYVINNYKRFHYRFTAKTSYNKFVALIFGLYRNKVPFALYKCTITATSHLNINADIEFTLTTTR